MVTGERWRGKGYGRALARASLTMMQERGADIGIFTCDRHLQGFYEGAGWEHLPGTVLVGGTPEDPFPSDRFDKVTMASFFSAKGRGARPIHRSADRALPGHDRQAVVTPAFTRPRVLRSGLALLWLM